MTSRSACCHLTFTSSLPGWRLKVASPGGSHRAGTHRRFTATGDSTGRGEEKHQETCSELTHVLRQAPENGLGAVGWLYILVNLDGHIGLREEPEIRAIGPRDVVVGSAASPMTCGGRREMVRGDCTWTRLLFNFSLIDYKNSPCFFFIKKNRTWNYLMMHLIISWSCVAANLFCLWNSPIKVGRRVLTPDWLPCTPQVKANRLQIRG